MEYCTNCGFNLQSPEDAFCTQCGSNIGTAGELLNRLGQAATSMESATAVFLANARLGLNRWWRWGIGISFVLLIWQVIGLIPFMVACAYVNNAQMPQFTCDDLQIAGDSLVPGYILSNYGFIIGIIGVWITVKLIHKKTLTQVTTGRVTFDYNRALYAIWVGVSLNAVVLILNLLFFDVDMTFRAPNPWEYITFFLFAIVLTPYQAALEEVFFRGYLLQGVSLITRNRFVLVATTSLLFMAPHLANPEPFEYGFAPYVSMLLLWAAFMALLTLVDGGIELAVGYHAINNLWIALIANTEVTAMLSPSLFVVPMEGYTLFPDVIFESCVMSILFVIFNQKYRWFRWRDVTAKVLTTRS